MSGFEPRISGVGSDRSTNFTTSTAQVVNFQQISDSTFVFEWKSKENKQKDAVIDPYV